MRVVAYTELVIFVRIALGAITFQNSLISPIIYAHFLRQRYYQSPFTREALAGTTARINSLVSRPGVPPQVAQVWDKVQMLAGRWAGSHLQPNPAPPAGAAPRQ